MRVLAHAVRDEAVRQQAQGAAAVERLWDACQIPDYRKISPAAHAELVTTLYDFLMRRGRIPDAWFAAQIAQADRTDGGIAPCRAHRADPTGPSSPTGPMARRSGALAGDFPCRRGQIVRCPA